MLIDPETLLDAEHKLRAQLQQRVEQTAKTMLRNYLLANPSSTPGELLTAMFAPEVTVIPDDVITVMLAGIRADDITVGLQRRLTWVGP